ncbi:transglutaminase-like cysteine peptidase [Parahaliea mediterranea]|nr:transglutaminase-like cysteine peptidase [Parahaliea mediterranea]
MALLLGVLMAGTLALATVDLDRMQRLAAERYGQQTAATVAEWRKLIDDITPLPDAEKLSRVNRFFNERVVWKQDAEIWRQNDYWATPLETLGRGLGDCEDFSVAKYMTLLLAGVEIEKLRITYVKAQMGGAYSKVFEAHMVLAYYASPAADPDVLDNMIDEIRPASRRPDLKPVFGFNSQGLWVRGAVAPATRNPGAKLSRWRDLLQRMAADGLG